MIKYVRKAYKGLQKSIKAFLQKSEEVKVNHNKYYANILRNEEKKSHHLRRKMIYEDNCFISRY